MALIPFDDRDGTIWLNGEIIPWRDAKTHTLSHGLHYASLVFEGERVYSGTIFKGREHTQRLRNSGKLMDFDIPMTDDEIDAAKMAVIKDNGITDGYVRAYWHPEDHQAKPVACAIGVGGNRTCRPENRPRRPTTAPALPDRTWQRT